MKANNDHYQIITGKITDLQVIDTDIALFGKGTFASLPLLGQLALGNTTETANQRGMDTNQSTFSLNILSNFRVMCLIIAVRKSNFMLMLLSAVNINNSMKFSSA